MKLAASSSDRMRTVASPASCRGGSNIIVMRTTMRLNPSGECRRLERDGVVFREVKSPFHHRLRRPWGFVVRRDFHFGKSSWQDAPSAPFAPRLPTHLQKLRIKRSGRRISPASAIPSRWSSQMNCLAPPRNANFKAVVCVHLSYILPHRKNLMVISAGVLDRSVNFLSGVGQPVRIDVDSDLAARTCHVFVRLQAPDCLPRSCPQFGH